MFDVASFTLASALAASGTVTVGYPSGRSKGDYLHSDGKHVLVADGNTYSAPASFSLTFNANASSITLTWAAGMRTLAAGTTCRLEMSRAGQNDRRPLEAPAAALAKVSSAPSYLISLGSPNVADADGICASQSGTAATAMTINGALAASGVATFDVPRNVVGAWTGTAVLTVTGTDEYGGVIVESSASGTTMAGKKAFKTITSVVPSASTTSATVGSGDVLGLPVALPTVSMVVREIEDSATATAGTLVAADRAKGTATTGDVRGTYDPNSAADGNKGFALVVALSDPTNRGVPQFAG